MVSSIRDLLVQAAEEFGDGAAIRYKAGKNEIVSKSYSELNRDSKRFPEFWKNLASREPI